MALICRKCHADVTDEYQLAHPRKPFACPKCESRDFRFVADEPKVPFELTENDRKFLRRLQKFGRVSEL